VVDLGVLAEDAKTVVEVVCESVVEMSAVDVVKVVVAEMEKVVHARGRGCPRGGG
jgi:hypothetical protein